MRVDGEGWLLEVEVQHDVRRLRPDPFYIGQPVLCVLCVHIVKEGERVLAAGLRPDALQ